MEMVADRMLILDKGKKLVEGHVNELFDPAKSLLELEVNNPEVVATKIKSGRWNVFVKEIRNGRIIFQLPKRDIPSLTNDLVSLGAEIVSLQPKHSLEDYFLSLTTANQHVDTFAN
jgi:ABC-2 type transport system ATP-binding protein